MASHVDIRAARSGDLGQIVAIMNAGAVGARAALEGQDLAPYQDAFKAILDAPEVDIYVAVDADGQVLATYQLTIEKGLAFQGRPRASIESMHTRSDQRGQGVGAALVAHAKKLAREKGCCLLQLTSNAQREDAHRFYQRQGFEQTHLGFKFML
ncbi:GNAT family N-acetyltransferase [Pseudovibrio exalbescens]|uniref:GNAT family N-acetyltransferase n=1 Tax=Pseudovibrio exalbescens TaxID=197461 RepID=UPI001AD8FA6C|nr:GNAT family N-acetyltransferase [Pseudovibrio exalbescens]